jgi:hypothetical protein
MVGSLSVVSIWAVLQFIAAIEDIQLLDMLGENVKVLECGLGSNPIAN